MHSEQKCKAAKRNNFTEGSGLRTSKRLPVRDTFVLAPFHCLAFLVPSQSYRHVEKTQRETERSGGCVGEKVGVPNTQRIKVELGNG